MPHKELENLVSQVDALASKLKNCAAGPVAGTMVIELAQQLVASQLSTDYPEARDKVEKISIELQPKCMGVNWSKAFERPLEGKFTPASIRLVLDLLWIIGGPRVMNAFFAMRPSDAVSCRSIVESLMSLEPSELGTKYHLPAIIDGMYPAEPLNYETVAPMLLYAMPRVDSFLRDPLIAALVLAFASRLSDRELAPQELRVLQDSAVHLVAAPIAYFDAVVAKVAKNPGLALQVFEKVRQSPNFIAAIANTYSTSLLKTWASSESHFRDIIDFLFRADFVAPSPMWSDFLLSFVGSNDTAFRVLLDYTPYYLAATHSESEGKDKPKLSLRVVSAIATLSLTAEPPSDKNAPEQVDKIHSLQLLLLQDYPRLINFGEGHDEAIMENEYYSSFSPDIETEMKVCFEKMYEQQHDIQEVISFLERLKESEIPRDQDLFACMIHSLFDEYRFFPQYPVKALATTAVLFGSLVHFRLIDGVPLQIALKFILDSLRQDPDNNMFRFGLQALIEMRQRLTEVPKYCKVLVTIPGIQRHPHFFEQIKSIADPVVGDTDHISLFTSIFDGGIEDSSLKSYSNASTQVSEKVRLIINNLTVKNADQKAEELANELAKQSPINFVKLLVYRAATEHNNHDLYTEVLSRLPYDYTVYCVDAIVSLISAIFNDKDALSPDNRNVAKGLGAFLGSLTLAENRPLVYQQIHLKLLLAEAVRYEKVPAVLPFVARILAQTTQSKVFVKTNPWVASLLATLSELYQFGSLPLTQKFEIEVLGNALGAKIEDLEPAFYIRSEVKQQEDAASITATRGGPAVLNSLPVIAAPQQSIQLGTGLRGTIPAAAATAAAAAAAAGAGPGSAAAGLATFPNSAQVPNVPPTGSAGMVPSVPPGQMPIPVGGTGVPPNSLPPQVAPGVPIVGTTEFASHPTLRQLLDLSRSKTLQDVLLPVIDRSVSIACFTTKELVLKDFMNEPDEGKLQAAAHVPALNLAASMAIVTAKEPFIEALAHNLRTLVVSQGYGDAQALLDQISIAARETMDSLVPLVESVAKEKAAVEVEETLLPEYKLRQQSRQMGRPFKSHNAQKSQISLPEGLEVKPNGVSDEQFAVYENFAVNLHIEEPQVFQDSLDAGSSFSGSISSHGLSVELQKLSAELKSLEELTKSSQKRLGEQDKDDHILQVLSKITNLVRVGSKVSEEIPLRASHLVVHSLFGPESTKSTLYRESLCYLLGELCRMSGLTAKEVVLWLLYADDAKKYNANVIGTLLRGRLVTPTEIDASLTKDVSEADVKPEVVDYAARLLLDALVGPEPYCLRSDFAGTIMALSKLNTELYPAAEILIQTLQETRGNGSGNEGHIFAEWTRLMQHHASAYSPALLHAFVRDLHELGWGSNPEQLMYFVRTAVTVSIKSYNQSKSFVGVDAIAVLLTTLLHTVKENENLATSIFTTIFLLISRDHEAGAFESLPYYRLLSSVACSLPHTYLEQFCSMLLTLQPLAFPGFASSWITLISHRFVMGRLLSNKKQWPILEDLLKALLCFTRETWLSSSTDAAVRGYVFRALERIFLVILNDEPTFFIRYGDEITAHLVSEFIQLRNIVLCAFPEGVELPNPVSDTPVEYADVSVETKEAVEDAAEYLTERNVIKLIENACLPRPQLTPQIVSAIQTALSFSTPLEDRGIDFESINVSMVGYNAFATYVAHLYNQQPPPSGNVEDSSAAQLCGRMLLTLSRENRYAFASAVANQLRYPEKHTYFFKGFVLALFTGFGERMFKDGISEARHVVTRALFERLMAHRPHPWGLMNTFSELLKSEKYNFREMPFIKSSPDVSVLFSTLYAHISTPEIAS